MGLDLGYLASEGRNLAKFGHGLAKFWPNLNFQGRDLKFASKVGFHASKKPMGLDLGYLASKGPSLAKFGQICPDLAKPQFSD